MIVLTRVIRFVTTLIGGVIPASQRIFLIDKKRHSSRIPHTSSNATQHNKQPAITNQKPFVKGIARGGWFSPHKKYGRYHHRKQNKEAAEV